MANQLLALKAKKFPSTVETFFSTSARYACLQDWRCKARTVCVARKFPWLCESFFFRRADLPPLRVYSKQCTLTIGIRGPKCLLVFRLVSEKDEQKESKIPKMWFAPFSIFLQFFYIRYIARITREWMREILKIKKKLKKKHSNPNFEFVNFGHL